MGFGHVNQILVGQKQVSDLLPPVDRVGRKVVVAQNGNSPLFPLLNVSSKDNLLTMKLFIRLLVSIALGVPLTIILWQRGNPKKSSKYAVGETRGANHEYRQNAEGNQGGERTVKGQGSGPNVHDKVLYTLVCSYEPLRLSCVLPMLGYAGFWRPVV